MRQLLLVILLWCGFVLLANGAKAEDIARGVKVVVIDPGHGGAKFPGATYAGIKEKDLTLAVALKLERLIEKELPGVKPVLTRKTDKLFSENLNTDLKTRANKANEAGGDLFISIHVNAARSTAARGVETLVMGESERGEREKDDVLYANNREDLLDMSDRKTAAIVRAYLQNLKFTYGEYSEALARLVQKHYVRAGRHSRGVKPQPLKVLYGVDMPGVLTEIGFLSNPEERRYLCSEKGQSEIARAIFNAVRDYVALIEGMRGAEDESAAGTAAVAKPDPEASESSDSGAGDGNSAAASSETEAVKKGYTIQLLSSTKRLRADDRQFGNYRNRVIEFRSAGRYKYKYAFGRYATREEALRELPEVKRSFGDAYVVAFDGDAIVK